MPIEIEVIPISKNSDLYQCSILRIGEYRILLDCGWTENFDVSLLSGLVDNEMVLQTIDAVLISHYDIGHCGSLPFLMNSSSRRGGGGGFKKNCRIFSTECVRRMGELTLASLHEDIDKVKDCYVSDESYLMTIEDIVTAFAHVEPLQFNECVEAGFEVGQKITISAHPAGRLFGGAYWVITIGSQRIVYAVDYSLVSDTHVGGMAIAPAKKANVVITDLSKSSSEDSTAAIGSGTRGASKSSKRRQSLSIDAMMSLVKSTLRAEGSVLFPMEANCRVLELLLALESAFLADSSLIIYPIVFLSPLGDVVLDQVKTRMEWMNSTILGDFENSVNFSAHPFILNHVQVMSSLADFNEAYSYRKPKIVIATCASLEYGDSREIFCRMCSDENNMVLFTETAGLIPGSLADRVIRDIDGGGGATADGSNNAANLVYKERQFIKSNIPDEQLRDVYRESLQREAQDDEIRRRRAREKFLASSSSAGGHIGAISTAPSSASAVPVDLIRLSNESYEEIDGSSFFRPQLFVAQTIASSAIVSSTKSQASDYGQQLSQIEIDTWRAHAETSELGAAREASQEAAAAAAQAASGGSRRVKSEQRIKGAKEEMIKGDIDNEDSGRVKGELGLTTALTGGDSFDWRRDMTVRFGEPKRIETRERIIKIVCKIKVIPMDGHAQSVHRREFISSVKPKTLIVLPSRNARDLQVLSLMLTGTSTNILQCQEPLGGEDIIPIPVETDIAHEKIWMTVDPSSGVEFTRLGTSDIRIAKLDSTAIVGPLRPGMVPDLVQVPSGDYVQFGVVSSASDSKRARSDQMNHGGLFVSEKPLRLNGIAQEIQASGFSGRVEFVNSGGNWAKKRALLVSSKAGGDEVLVTAGDEAIEVVGVPSDNFYKIRKLLYARATCI